MPIYEALNLQLINEFALPDDGWEPIGDRIAEYLSMAGLAARTIPIPAERSIARQQAADRERAEREAEKLAALERIRATKAAKLTEEPKWGTPEAKRREIERVRREIESRKK